MKNKRTGLPHRVAIFLCLYSLLFSLTGCTPMREINDMAIVSGAAFDYDVNQDVYRITAEITNKNAFAPDKSDLEQPVIATGKTIADAMFNCNNAGTREIYWAHAKTFLVSRSLAEKKGLSPILDYVMRNYKTRLSIDLILCDFDNAASLLSLDAASGNIKFLNLEEMLMTGKRFSGASTMKVYQAVALLDTETTQLTLPLISVENNVIKFHGTAVFHKDRFVGTLTETETLYLLFLKNQLKKANISLTDGSATFSVLRSETKLYPTEQNKGFTLQVKIQTEATLSQLADTSQALSLEAMENAKFDLTNALEDTIEKNTQALIKKAQSELQADIFGFGRALKQENPSLFGAIHGDWSKVGFSSLPVSVTCQVKLLHGETQTKKGGR